MGDVKTYFGLIVALQFFSGGIRQGVKPRSPRTFGCHVYKRHVRTVLTHGCLALAHQRDRGGPCGALVAFME